MGGTAQIFWVGAEIVSIWRQVNTAFLSRSLCNMKMSNAANFSSFKDVLTSS